MGRAAHPIQITNGPLSYQAPITANTGHRLFFIGKDSRSMLLKFDATSNNLCRTEERRVQRNWWLFRAMALRSHGSIRKIAPYGRATPTAASDCN